MSKNISKKNEEKLKVYLAKMNAQPKPKKPEKKK
jgi:hypothetical protein